MDEIRANISRILNEIHWLILSVLAITVLMAIGLIGQIYYSFNSYLMLQTLINR